jgi:hypothetical protein
MLAQDAVDGVGVHMPAHLLHFAIVTKWAEKRPVMVVGVARRRSCPIVRRQDGAVVDLVDGQQDATWAMDPPVRGSFRNGVGTFYANDDIDDGKPVRTRLLWSEITPTSGHWEQAESPDGGKTWETD